MDPSSSFRASTSTETQSSPDDTAPFIKYAINHQSSSARTTTFGRRVLAIRKYFGSQCKTISRSLIRSAIQTKEVLRRQRSRVRVTMSLFSRLRSARKAVRERRARSKKQDDGKEVSKDKYRHVPTHAAVDALSGAPSAWKLEDQSKIKEFHLRRSELVLRCHETTVLSGGGRTPLLKKPSYLSRNSSLLTEGSQKASFNSSEDELLIPSIPSLEPSPVPSQTSSLFSMSSSVIDLRTHPKPKLYNDSYIFDRLHTSTTRKVGEAPMSTSPLSREPLLPPQSQESFGEKRNLRARKNRHAIYIDSQT